MPALWKGNHFQAPGLRVLPQMLQIHRQERPFHPFRSYLTHNQERSTTMKHVKFTIDDVCMFVLGKAALPRFEDGKYNVYTGRIVGTSSAMLVVEPDEGCKQVNNPGQTTLCLDPICVRPIV